MLDPPLKWVGSKRRLVDIILPLIPDHQNYYEPFLGSGAIFFAYIQKQINKKKAYYLSDINADLVNLWQNIQSNLSDLLIELKAFKYSNTREEYHHFRKLFNEHHIHDVYKAALFLFLLNTSFNGLVRYNSQGGFNAAWGNRPFTFNALEPISAILNEHEVHISTAKYDDVYPKSGDFVFLDPPYLPIENRAIDDLAYAPELFGLTAHKKLAQWCCNLDDISCNLLLCNNLVPETPLLYPSSRFKITEVSLLKIFTGHVLSRKNTIEVLVQNGLAT